MVRFDMKAERVKEIGLGKQQQNKPGVCITGDHDHYKSITRQTINIIYIYLIFARQFFSFSFFFG